MAAREITRSIVIVRVDESRREVFGEVGVPLQQYSPGQIVSVEEYRTARAEGRIHYDGGCWTIEDLREMAHRFLSQAGAAAFDQQHDKGSGIAVCIESFVATATMEPWREGSWVVGVRVLDDAVWAKIQDGSYKGFSVRMLALDDAVEISLDDGTKIKLTYFRDPTPVLVSIVDRPATGRPFEVVRFVSDANAPQPEPAVDTTPVADAAKPDEVPEVEANPPAPAATAPTPTVEDRAMPKPGLFAKMLKVFSRAAAGGDDEAKSLVDELGTEYHEVDRSVCDFAQMWQDGAASADMWRAFDLLQCCVVWDAMWEVNEKRMTVEEAKASVATSIDQFKLIVLAAFDKVVVNRAEGAGTELAQRSPGSAMVDHVRFITEKAIDRKGAKLSVASRAKVDEAKAAAETALTALQALIDSVDGTEETETENACKDKNRSEGPGGEVTMDADTKKVVEELRAELDAQKAAVEQLRAEPAAAPAAPAATAPAAQPNPEIEALRSEIAQHKAEVERLRSRRPAAQAASPDLPPDPSEGTDEKRNPVEVFRSCNKGTGFLTSCLLSGGFDKDLCRGDEDTD